MKFPGKESFLQLAIQPIVRTTTKHTLSKILLGRDAIPSINQGVNWKLIKKFQQTSTINGDDKENHTGQSHIYHTGDIVLLKNA